MRVFEFIYKSFLEILFVSLLILFFLIIWQFRGGDAGIFELGNWRYVHLGDASENIKNALFLSKGGKLNVYVTSNHMPGLYLYLSLFFTLLPKMVLINSVSNGVFIFAFSSFVTILTIVGFTFFSVRLMVKDNRVILFSKICFSFILLYLFLKFDYYRVLSETYLPFFQLTYLSLFGYYLRNRTEGFSYLVASFYVIGLSIFFGLTNLFTDLSFFLFFSYFLVIDFRKIRFQHFIPLVFLFVFIILKSGNFNFNYWIVETNKAQGFGSGLSMFKMILENSFFWPANWYKLHAFGPLFDHRIFVLILGLFAIVISRKNLAFVLFLILGILVLPLDSWRIPEQGDVWISQSYKTDVNMGICFFYLLVILENSKVLLDRLVSFVFGRVKFNIEKVIFQFSFMVVIIFSFIYIFAYISNFIEFEKLVTVNHSSWIEQKNICKQKFIKQNADCSCVSVMHWDQEFFLFNDVKPCINQFSSYSPHLNSDDKYFNIVRSSFLEENSFFLLRHTDLFSENSSLSPRLVELFRSGQCETITKDLLLLCRNKI